ncbi:hypothetical protein [Pimelobacter simplex]|uniref:hypothetical protein n=1 Tax=Nocardioides simplex TaxID=2045 RepID=UPI003AAF95FC
MKPLRPLLSLAAATATLLTLTATSAEAATTYTPGGGPAVNLVNQGGISFTDTMTGDVLDCSTLVLGGSVTSPGTSRPYAAEAGSLSAIDAGGAGSCWNAAYGASRVVPMGTWSLAVTGDAVGGVFPAKVSGIKFYADMTYCRFYVGGATDTATSPGTGWLTGTFDPATQEFTADTSPSGLVIATPPVGSTCPLLGQAEDDPIEVSAASLTDPAVWKNVAPASSSVLSISNP